MRRRTMYGKVLIAIGDWLQADEELTLAVRGSQAALPAVHADALSQLAELRLAQGRIEEADRLVQGLDDHRGALPAMAAIQLERGRVASAEVMLRRWIAPLDEAGLLDLVPHELLGEAELAQGEVERAADRGRALADAGERLDCDVVVARGSRLLGRAVASTDADAARAHLDAALIRFGELGMPLEAARTRVHLGRLLADRATEVAVDELRRALEVFDGLGAARDADHAAALLRDLGVKAARSGPAGETPRSPREREVLGLLGGELSNPEIAERLYISRRTVEHHVANVLAKLGVRSRGDAIADAIRFEGTVPVRGS